jgi:hypothetical protein
MDNGLTVDPASEKDILSLSPITRNFASTILSMREGKDILG